MPRYDVVIISNACLEKRRDPDHTKYLSSVATCKLRVCKKIHINAFKEDFKIQGVSDPSYNLNVLSKGHEVQIIVHGSNKNAVSIEGKKDSLLLLQKILNSRIGQSFQSVDSIIFHQNLAVIIYLVEIYLPKYEALSL